jgi:Rieske Fe-S protein
VGGGIVLASSRVVVTQPLAGTFKAFSAVCTHQGCIVGDVTANRISCPCHGSVFSATDGSVVSSPATSPLPELHVAVNGSNLTVTS